MCHHEQSQNKKEKEKEKLDQRSNQLGYQLTSSTNNLRVGGVVYYLIIFDNIILILYDFYKIYKVFLWINCLKKNVVF